MRTLVLDQGYQPHRIISWQRAVCMIFDGKVEVVEEYDEDIRSVTICIKMPAVVRLLRTIVGRKRAIKFS
ncbi:MAG: HNH endonuclease, partial [Deltaproteobacteria bacterium]